MAINKDKVRAAAQKFLQKGQIDKAIHEFERLVEDDPRDVRTLLKIGDLQTRAGQTADAAATYAKVAVFYSEQGFFLKAVAVYKQILKIDPSLVDVNQKLAQLYQQLGLVSDAVAQYRQIAGIYEQKGQLEESGKVVEMMIGLDPENIASRVKLAELQASRGLVEEARKGFRQVAASLKAQNRIDDYMKVAERIVHFDATDLVTHRELATLYLQRDDARRALAKLQICFKADPRDVETLDLLGSAFHKLGQLPKAVSVYRELAHIHRDAGREDAYQEVARRILRLAPGDEKTRESMGSTVSAPVVGSEPVVEIAPAAPAVQMPPPMPRAAPLPPSREAVAAPPAAASSAAPVLSVTKILAEADVYIKYGLRDKAIEHLRRIVELEPTHREARQRLRQVYEDGDDIDAAVAELWQMAQAAAREHDSAQAKSDLSDLLSLAPDHEQARVLSEMLDRGSSAPAPLPPVESAPERPIPSPVLVVQPVAALPQHEVVAREPEPVVDVHVDDVEIEVDLDVEDEAPAQPARVAVEPAATPTFTPSPPADEPDLSDEIEEIEFYVQQGLVIEARDTLAHLLDQHPMHPGLLALQATLQVEPDVEAAGALTAGGDFDWDEGPDEDEDVPEPVRVALASTSGSSDLASELATEFATLGEDDFAASVADVFEDFKRGVAEQVDDSDHETHYNLGIAYKEMGLFDDAIREFELARRSPDKIVGAVTMIGLCQLEQGHAAAAAEQFRSLLDDATLSAPEVTALCYELGRSYQLLGQANEAGALFARVCAADPTFRDAAARLAETRGAGVPPTGTPGGNTPRNGKISYV